MSQFCILSAMSTELPNSANRTGLLRSYPAVAYFFLAYAISWSGALLLVTPKLLHGQALSKLDGLLMFPVMLLGPSVAGITLTKIVDHQAGLKGLLSRMFKLPSVAHWYLPLLIPPVLIFAVLLSLKTFVSSVFTPNHFWIGILFGIPAGFFEEIGWTGFALPKLMRRYAAFPSAAILGILWACWHVPVVDYLGTATPHGSSWLSYFLAFAAAMTAVRIMIAWLYINTGSVLLAQFLHACSTGSLVIFSPARASASQEAAWYWVYAAGLWLVVGIILWRYGYGLKKDASPRLA
jgi:membrane protease YdiL (CAAX protease family)